MLPLFAAAALLLGAACTGGNTSGTTDQGDDTFVIEGTVSGKDLDGAILFLVPMYGPHPRPVDSVLLESDGHFRFEGNVEQMAKLTLDWHHRYGVQELIVCTEPGTTHVVLDSISSAEGTPQNNLLQQWKERLQSFNMDLYRVSMMKRQGAPDEITGPLRDSIRVAMGEFNYKLLSEAPRQSATIFMNKMFNGELDSLRRAELKEKLLDTTDYSLPQPGFRK